MIDPAGEAYLKLLLATVVFVIGTILLWPWFWAGVAVIMP